MNINRKQFLKAVERGKALLGELNKDYPELKLYPVFSRPGPRSGQCGLTTDLKKIVMEFPEMLTGSVGHERAQKLTKRLRGLLFEIKGAEKDGDKETASKLWKKANQVEGQLLDPELELYCGDVMVEFRCGVLKYDTLRRLQQDLRLPQDLNEVGNVRVVAESLKFLAGRKK